MTTEMYDRKRDQLAQETIAKFIEDGKTEQEAVGLWEKMPRCPYCGSTWVEDYGIYSHRCRHCLVVY